MKNTRRAHRLAHLQADDHDRSLVDRLPQFRSDAEADRLLAILDNLPSPDSQTKPNKPYTSPHEH